MRVESFEKRWREGTALLMEWALWGSNGHQRTKNYVYVVGTLDTRPGGLFLEMVLDATAMQRMKRPRHSRVRCADVIITHPSCHSCNLSMTSCSTCWLSSSMCLTACNLPMIQNQNKNDKKKLSGTEKASGQMLYRLHLFYHSFDKLTHVLNGNSYWSITIAV